MTDFAKDAALWRHLQAKHNFDLWTRADVHQAYGGESLEDIHTRDHVQPSGVRHEHRIGTPLAPESTFP